MFQATELPRVLAAPCQGCPSQQGANLLAPASVTQLFSTPRSFHLRPPGAPGSGSAPAPQAETPPGAGGSPHEDGGRPRGAPPAPHDTPPAPQKPDPRGPGSPRLALPIPHPGPSAAPRLWGPLVVLPPHPLLLASPRGSPKVRRCLKLFSEGMAAARPPARRRLLHGSGGGGQLRVAAPAPHRRPQRLGRQLMAASRPGRALPAAGEPPPPSRVWRRPPTAPRCEVEGGPRRPDMLGLRGCAPPLGRLRALRCVVPQ